MHTNPKLSISPWKNLRRKWRDILRTGTWKSWTWISFRSRRWWRNAAEKLRIFRSQQDLLTGGNRGRLFHFVVFGAGNNHWWNNSRWMRNMIVDWNATRRRRVFKRWRWSYLHRVMASTVAVRTTWNIRCLETKKSSRLSCGKVTQG